ncbi:MAG: BMC domain-containing protein [Deltaproteobacteria bacterium]|nr:BMC domain-containing protein [Deltaproteobacteria bacterium]
MSFASPSPAFESVALVEIEAISKGYVALDALVKQAPVNVRFAKAVTPGKFVIFFGGDVASVEEALEAAREVAQGTLVDELHLAQAHPNLLRAIDSQAAPAIGEAVGIVETQTVSSCILAADTALKMCDVAVLKMHLALNIGGKGYFTLAGPLADVQAALDGVKDVVPAERLVGVELIPNPHVEVRGFFS